MPESPTLERWRETVMCSMLTMSEEDRDWLRTQVCGKSEKWVRFIDSERLRKLLPLVSVQAKEASNA